MLAPRRPHLETGPQRGRRRPPLARTSAVVALALLGVLSAAACQRGQRFPVCQTDSECAARETGKAAPLCFNLKCVACRYDPDCPAGEVCTSLNECSRLTAQPPKDEGSGTGEGGGSGGPPADCAAQCKGDQGCLTACTEGAGKKK